MRTIRAFQGERPEPGAAERLSDEVLAAASANPDHSEAGRAAARDALTARGISAKPWRLRVPGFITPNELATRGERLFFGIGRAVRKWSGWAFYGIFVGVIVLAAVSESLGPPSDSEAFTVVWRDVMVETTLLVPLTAFALMIALAIWFFATALRRKPARLLLLRKFHVRAFAAPLERMIAHELRSYGHVASLSDKFIRRDYFGWVPTALLSLSNPLAAIWFVLGVPVRFVWRLFDRSRMGPTTVLNARDYRHLAGRLRDRVGLNLQTALTSKEAFLIRTSDAWWQMVIKLLMESSDAIVVDLTRVTEGTAWELDTIRSEGTEARCVFVALWGKAADAERALKQWGFTKPCHYYAPDGEMQHRTRFRAALLDAMRATHGLAA